jgi:hypothetical protein
MTAKHGSNGCVVDEENIQGYSLGSEYTFRNVPI